MPFYDRDLLGVILFLTGAQLALGASDLGQDKGERLAYHSRSRRAAVILRSPMNASTVMREVSAYNTAAASDNRIHDDCVARRFGFRGGLVPGVEVYAYMAHMPVARWGRAWLAISQEMGVFTMH